MSTWLVGVFVGVVAFMWGRWVGIAEAQEAELTRLAELRAKVKEIK